MLDNFYASVSARSHVNTIADKWDDFFKKTIDHTFTSSIVKNSKSIKIPWIDLEYKVLRQKAIKEKSPKNKQKLKQQTINARKPQNTQQ